MKSVFAVAAVIALLGLGGFAQAMEYRIVDLGTLGGNTSRATKINSVGQVVGWSLTGDGTEHAFIWTHGAMQDLGTLGGSNSRAFGLNDLGEVVGESEDASGLSRGFVWTEGSMSPLGGLISACDINNSGQVLGSADDSSAVIWQSGSITDLGSLADILADCGGINESAQVAGEAQGRGKLWTSGVETDLWSGWSNDINENGDVVGIASSIGAALWSDGKVTYLGHSGEDYYGSAAIALNNTQQIVGMSATQVPDPGNPYSHDHALLYEHGVMRDLGVLSGTYSEARGINDNGMICGSSTSTTGYTHAVLWVPILEPVYGISNRAAYDPIVSTASAKFSFKVWGKVTVLSGDSFSVDDGSGKLVTVVAPGFSGIQTGNYASVTGKFSGEGQNRVLNAKAFDVVKLR